MLTENQKELLEPLTHHSKYGKLLSEAIKTWEEVKPATDDYGVIFDPEYQKFVSTNNKKCCCLIGAAILNKFSESFTVMEATRLVFNIDDIEISHLIVGFDDIYSQHVRMSDAYKFAKEVSKIVLC